jgi:hypothetical protein
MDKCWSTNLRNKKVKKIINLRKSKMLRKNSEIWKNEINETGLQTSTADPVLAGVVAQCWK